MTDAPMRIFTVAEAEATLPLVGRIVTDALAAHDAWRESVREFEALAGLLDPADGMDERIDALAAAVQGRAAEVERLLGELRALGCIFKGFDGGLVDFYSLRGDRLIFLCWRLGEPTLAYWHELDAGFAGRQPIDGQLLTGTVQ